MSRHHTHDTAAQSGQRSGHHGAHHGGHPSGHAHADSAHVDWNEMATLLECQAEIQSPLYAQAAAWLGELAPAHGVRRILDIGSGPGVLTSLLAEAFPAAEVVAVDPAPELLERARARAEARGLGSRVSTLTAQLPEDVADLGEADLIWAGNSLHHVGDQRAALASLARLLRPGGVMALVEGGLPARHLPWNIGIGRPGLEARIDAANSDWFGRMRAALPGTKDEVDDWRGLLTAAGLTPSGTRSFLLDLPAPVPDAVREQVVAAFDHQRGALEGQLAADDQQTLDRLLDPADPRGLYRRTDVFQLSVRTVHTARRG